MEVQIHRYEYGKPLVKDEKSLTTMMQRFHNWYMETCRESEGKNALYLHIKEEHDLVANDLLTVPFEEFFEFFNQKALDKLMVFCYCLQVLFLSLVCIYSSALSLHVFIINYPHYIMQIEDRRAQKTRNV